MNEMVYCFYLNDCKLRYFLKVNVKLLFVTVFP